MKQPSCKAILVLVLLLHLSGTPAAALQPAAPAVLDEPLTRVVLIEEKAPGPHFIYVEERAFRMSPDAVLEDTNGNPLTLEGLPVPCTARITFYLYGGNRYPYVTRLTLLN